MSKPGKRDCLFCGAPLAGVRAREHVLPQWLLRHLGATGYRALSYSTADEFEHRSQVAAGFVEGRVCATCNNGWMAQMEAHVKPVLVELIDGARDVRELDADQRSLLARWAAKTAFMFQTSGLAEFHPPPTLLSPLVSGDLPRDVYVVGFTRDATTATPFELESGWLYNPMWTLLPPCTEAEARFFKTTHARTVKVTIWVRRLVLTAAYWPDERWSPVRWRGWHEPVSSNAAGLPSEPWEEPNADDTANDLMQYSHARLTLRAPSALAAT
jgi:hypothetical protein